MIYIKYVHFVDRNLLRYKLQLSGIDGYMYNTIASLYTDTESCISIVATLQIGQLCYWCSTRRSPTLFSIFTYDLATVTKELDLSEW